MEPLPKRLRLYKPLELQHSNSYGADEYIDPCDEEDSFIDDEGVEGEDLVEIDAAEEPDVELDQKRARLDYKLKSKFEAIFEKYGRDFTGIGDEIDLRTGEIVVNNGHLLEMQGERDAGLSEESLLDAFTQDPGQHIRSVDLEEDETDNSDEFLVNPEDMEEDDMILFQRAGVISARTNTPPPRPHFDRFAEQGEGILLNSTSEHEYPSNSQIMAQFGERLGPQIARYVSQQRVQDNANVESAWRTPGLPLATPGKRPILKSILLDQDVDRSPSPEGSSSVWAPQKPRGRPRRDGTDVAAIFRGETIVRDRKWYSSGYVSTTVTRKTTERSDPSQSRKTMSVPLKDAFEPSRPGLGLGREGSLRSTSTKLPRDLVVSDSEAESSYTESSADYSHNLNTDSEYSHTSKEPVSWGSTGYDGKLPASGTFHPRPKHAQDKRKRVKFTREDDELLVEWAEEALQQGYSIWCCDHWKILAEKNPQHTHLSWAERYRRLFWPNRAKTLLENGYQGSLLEVVVAGPTGSPAPRKTHSESGHKLDEHSSADKSIHEISRTDCTLNARTQRSRRPTDGNPGCRKRTALIMENCDGDKMHLDDDDDISTISVSKAMKSSSCTSRGERSTKLGSKSPSIQRLKHFPGSTLDPSYKFSDGEDDGEAGNLKLSMLKPVLVQEASTDTIALTEQSSLVPRVSEEQHVWEMGGTAQEPFTQPNTPEEPPVYGIELYEEHPSVKRGNSTAQHSLNVETTQGELYFEKIPETPSSIGIEGVEEIHPGKEQSKSPVKRETPRERLSAREDTPQKHQTAHIEAHDQQISIPSETPQQQPSVARDNFEEQRATQIMALDESSLHISAEVDTLKVSIEDDESTYKTTINLPKLCMSSQADYAPQMLARTSSPRMQRFQLQRHSSPRNPRTPNSARSSWQRQTLSSILGPDDFDELFKSSARRATAVLQERSDVPEKHIGSRLGTKDDVKEYTARTPTAKPPLVGRQMRRNCSMGGINASPGCSVIQTPGGSFKRCGEKGYRCIKDFCFQCLEDDELA